jgi:mono/diheme cytochrome c family protein
MRIVRTGVVTLCLLAAAVAAFVVAREPPLIDKIAVPPRSDFAPAAIEQGAKLAAIGNCHTCHTAAGNADYAGSRAVPTPFGTVYSTNITPAPGSGIGHWSEAAFGRAMRHGITRRGRHLYPAFPYDHFAQLSDADIHAIYAFIMTRRPVETYQTANDVMFPLDERWLMDFWNLLFPGDSRFRPDPNHDAEWNRGAYLVDGLGHCGSCHTPRNLLGGEIDGRALAGGEAGGWTAPALSAASPAPVPWDATQLFAYLRHGWAPEHGAAAGPMQDVIDNLASADDADLRAIAVYLASLQGADSAQRRERAQKALAAAAQPPAPGEALGAALFAGACGRCHGGDAAMAPPRGINLALSTAVSVPDPRDAIHIVLDGIPPRDEQAGPMMPSFADAFTDAQAAAVLAYVRAHYGTGPAWPDLEARIPKLRHGKGQP